MNKEKAKYRVRDIEKTSQKLLSMLFEMCEMYISEDKDEHSKIALASTAMAARGAILTFLALIRKC